MFGFGSKNQDKFLVFSNASKEGEKPTFDMTFFSLTYIPPEPKTKEKPPNAWFARGTQLTLEEDTIIDKLDIEDHGQKTEDGKPTQAIQTLENCKFKSVKFYEPSRFKKDEKDPKGLIITFDIMFDDLEKKKTFWEKKNGGRDLLFLSMGRSNKGGMFSSGGNPIPVFRQLTDGGSDQPYYKVVDLVISEGVKDVGYDSYFIDSLKEHLMGKHQSEETSKTTPDAAPGTDGRGVAESFKGVGKAVDHLSSAVSEEKAAPEEQKKGGKGKKTYRKKYSKKHKKKRISKKRRINGKK